MSMPVMQALLYLRLMMLRNRVLSFVRRLKQPRYLLGLGMAFLYFWGVFFRTAAAGRSPANFLAGGSDFVELICAGLVSMLVLVLWSLPGEKSGLHFSEAEVAFLFPAPLKRSQLIHYKLLTGVFASLVGAMFLTLVTTRFRGGLEFVLQRFGAAWMLTSLASLHSTAVVLTLAKLGISRFAVMLRRSIVIAMLLLFVMSAIYLIVNGTHEQLRQLLAPGRFFLQLFFATGTEYAIGFAWMLLLFMLHYWWVLRMETPFEEAAIAVATRFAELRAKMLAGKSWRLAGKAKARREPFVLGPKLPVELVLLWKNLMLVPAYLNRRVFVISFFVITIGVRWLRERPEFSAQAAAGTLGMFALIALAYMLLFAPQVLRNDLRADLAQADLLKAWPLPGWRIVLGNLLAPVVVMTAVGWLFVLTAASGIMVGGKLTPWLTGELKLALSVSVALLLPAFSALLLLGPNAMALYFPAWSQMGMSTQRGLDTMGLRLILMLGQLVLLTLTLIPCALLAALAFFLSQWFVSATAGMVLAAVAGLVVLLLEILYAIHLLGERFEQLDIGAELRQ